MKLGDVGFIAYPSSEYKEKFHDIRFSNVLNADVVKEYVQVSKEKRKEVNKILASYNEKLLRLVPEHKGAWKENDHYPYSSREKFDNIVDWICQTCPTNMNV